MIKISLSYKFGGETYNHKHGSVFYQSSSFNDVSAKRSDFVGQEIIILCNPGDPSQYMIKQEIQGLKSIWVGFIFIGAGILVAWLGR